MLSLYVLNRLSPSLSVDTAVVVSTIWRRSVQGVKIIFDRKIFPQECTAISRLFLRQLVRCPETTSLPWVSLKSISIPYSLPTFQRRINVVSTLWINVKITLIRRCEWNKIRRRIFNIAQRWYNFTTLKKRWYNFISALLQRGLNITKGYIPTSWASDKYGFVNR